MFVTNRTDTETGVFLLVKKYMDDGLYAQISLYCGWIWVRLWRQSEGIIAIIIKYLFCLYYFLRWWLHWKSVLSLAILFLSQVVVKEAYESHNLMEDVRFVYLQLLFYCYMEEITQKEWIKIVQITKQEAMILNRDYKIRYAENGISHTYTKNRKYYLCERTYNINALEKIRKIQSVG